MLIVCPSCASEYTIDPAHVRPEGRTVRCAGCRTTFRVEPAAEADLSPDDWSRLLDEAGVPPAAGALSVDASAAREAPPPAPKPKGTRRLPSAAGLAARLASPLRRVPASLVLALALAAIVTGLLAQRMAVVRLVPATARLYAAIGLPVNLRGLELRAVASQVTGTGSELVLTVEGEIANPSARAVDVPQLLIALLAGDGQALYTWTSEPPRKSLEGGETTRFRARLAAPPLEGRDVLVRFAPAIGGAVAAR
ncbi:zinc-ribbon domain-containing protein [Salinarimonas soli]|uniref:Zinc finger/thioredoxin putative domain-containing protein n=1 Tax=Salinarimonas soli TaxID=1638099 RepID=A0A5B2V939_9HYPH|nr:zinc-ribbon domain-containing protein [Salinarimonas soli]KAA2236013.1 hypothetical protein F0L46_16680 [Salinarimonas soli]